MKLPVQLVCCHVMSCKTQYLSMTMEMDPFPMLLPSYSYEELAKMQENDDVLGEVRRLWKEKSTDRFLERQKDVSQEMMAKEDLSRHRTTKVESKVLKPIRKSGTSVELGSVVGHDSGSREPSGCVERLSMWSWRETLKYSRSYGGWRIISILIQSLKNLSSQIPEKWRWVRKSLLSRWITFWSGNLVSEEEISPSTGTYFSEQTRLIQEHKQRRYNMAKLQFSSTPLLLKLEIWAFTLMEFCLPIPTDTKVELKPAIDRVVRGKDVDSIESPLGSGKRGSVPKACPWPSCSRKGRGWYWVAPGQREKGISTKSLSLTKLFEERTWMVLSRPWAEGKGDQYPKLALDRVVRGKDVDGIESPLGRGKRGSVPKAFPWPSCSRKGHGWYLVTPGQRERGTVPKAFPWPSCSRKGRGWYGVAPGQREKGISTQSLSLTELFEERTWMVLSRPWAEGKGDQYPKPALDRVVRGKDVDGTESPLGRGEKGISTQSLPLTELFEERTWMVLSRPWAVGKGDQYPKACPWPNCSRKGHGWYLVAPGQRERGTVPKAFPWPSCSRKGRGWYWVAPGQREKGISTQSLSLTELFEERTWMVLSRPWAEGKGDQYPKPFLDRVVRGKDVDGTESPLGRGKRGSVPKAFPWPSCSRKGRGWYWVAPGQREKGISTQSLPLTELFEERTWMVLSRPWAEGKGDQYPKPALDRVVRGKDVDGTESPLGRGKRGSVPKAFPWPSCSRKGHGWYWVAPGQREKGISTQSLPLTELFEERTWMVLSRPWAEGKGDQYPKTASLIQKATWKSWMRRTNCCHRRKKRYDAYTSRIQEHHLG